MPHRKGPWVFVVQLDEDRRFEAVHQKGLRVAVFDFDVHHGNGTEEMLLGCPETLFDSKSTNHLVIQERGWCIILPIPGTIPSGPTRKQRSPSSAEALEDVHAFQPDLVGVSAGFDAYRLDPLAQASLEVEDYLWIGEQVALLPCRPLPFWRVATVRILGSWWRRSLLG